MAADLFGARVCDRTVAGLNALVDANADGSAERQVKGCMLGLILERRSCYGLSKIMVELVISVIQKVLQFQSLVRLAAMLPLLSSVPLPIPLPTALAGVRVSPLAAASTLSSFHFPYMPQQCPHPL